ncbi:MAG: PLP-dependent aminotransferase family protein [Actinomycetota bacterium]|nr:PLP-dependent aminotransferase family protein [Actinomycetota bacterium]
MISFARGAPAPECLAVEELADCARAAIQRDGAAVLGYGPGGGYPPLRDWIAERHGVEPARVLLTNGSLQGFVYLCEHLLPGRVLVEAPTYDRPLKVLARLGAEIVAVPQDEDGLLVEQVDGPAAFLYVIPTFQNPSGRTLPLERRRALADLARNGLLVLEDDPYGLVRFDGEPLPTVFELAGGENVIYASSFSKTVAPGLRVGYLVLPPQLVAPLEDLAVSTTISPVLAGQATVMELIRRGRFEPNLERVRRLLRKRRDAMLAALADRLPDGARWSRPQGGYFLWLDLPGIDTADLLERALAGGVGFVKGADFFVPGGGGDSSARLAYSFASGDEIEQGIERLSALLPARV